MSDVVAEIMFSTAIDLQILEFVVAVMELLGNPVNGGFNCLFSFILESKFCFLNHHLIKMSLGKFCML